MRNLRVLVPRAPAPADHVLLRTLPGPRGMGGPTFLGERRVIRLSERELQVLACRLRGDELKETAAALGIDMSSAYVYERRALAKIARVRLTSLDEVRALSEMMRACFDMTPGGRPATVPYVLNAADARALRRAARAVLEVLQDGDAESDTREGGQG